MKNRLVTTLAIFTLLVYGVVPMNLGIAKPDGALVVTPGADPTAFLLGYSKYRNFTTENSWEIFLGLDSAIGSSDQAVWDTANTFSFIYDLNADKLTTTITNTLGVWSYDYLNYSTQVLNQKGALAYSYLNALNYLQIRVVVENHVTTAVDLTGVTLDGNPLGDFSGVPGSSLDWSVTGLDLSAGFSLSGTLSFSGINSKSPEQNKVEFFIGRVDHEGPVSSNLIANPNPVGLNAPLSLSATVDDSTTGLSTVTSAEYRLGQGANWNSMSAQDGSFDQTTENVVATFPAPNQHGTIDLCVRGSDSALNQGTASCISLSVDGEGPAATSVNFDPDPVITTQPVTVTATISDTYTGGSQIVAAQYRTGTDPTWMSMQADDGAFDEVVENVRASLLASDTEGPYQVCVRGQDGIGNFGAETCANLTVIAPTPVYNNLYLPLVSKNVP